MHAYLITSPDHMPRVVFANSIDDAAELICAWHMLNDIDVTEFTIDCHFARRLPDQAAKMLARALRHGISGMARFDDDVQDWIISLPRDERQDE